MKGTLTAVAFSLAAACSSENFADWNEPGVLSPDGRAKARLLHIDGSPSSQVYISFDRGRCGGGSISAAGRNPDVTLSWQDATTLEISAAADLALEPAPASRELEHRVQCYDHVVDVVVRRR
jgi:hypothetical protein